MEYKNNIKGIVNVILKSKFKDLTFRSSIEQKRRGHILDFTFENWFLNL